MIEKSIVQFCRQSIYRAPAAFPRSFGGALLVPKGSLTYGSGVFTVSITVCSARLCAPVLKESSVPRPVSTSPVLRTLIFLSRRVRTISSLISGLNEFVYQSTSSEAPLVGNVPNLGRERASPEGSL